MWAVGFLPEDTGCEFRIKVGKRRFDSRLGIRLKNSRVVNCRAAHGPAGQAIGKPKGSDRAKVPNDLAVVQGSMECFLERQFPGLLKLRITQGDRWQSLLNLVQARLVNIRKLDCRCLIKVMSQVIPFMKIERLRGRTPCNGQSGQDGNN